MRIAPVLLLTLLPLPAFADCAGGEEVFTCQIGAKSLEICHQGTDLTYAFGPKGTPDLALTESLTTVNFTPWPGAGGAIWDTLAFQNDGYTYEVWAEQERTGEDDAPLLAGISVLKGEERVAELSCDPGTPSQLLEGIWDLKESVGLCWEFSSYSWKIACDNG